MMIALIPALAALAVSAPAPSHDAGNMPRTRTVSMAGLDLASLHGQRVAKRRLSWAIQEVCDDGNPPDLMPSVGVLRCHAHAWSQADRQLDTEIAEAKARQNVAFASR